MTTRAMQFSRRGDEVFNQFAKQFPDAARRRLLIDQPLAAARFAQIRLAMLEYLRAVLEADGPLTEGEALERLLTRRATLPNFTRGGMLAPAREHALAFNLLHQSVALALGDYVQADSVDGIDLPINVRLVYAQTDAGRAGAPFSSTKLHSDVWAGVPFDSIVIVLPVLGDIDNITIECYEMAAELEWQAMHAFSSYDAAEFGGDAKVYSNAAMQHGHLYLADVRLLHKTVRRQPHGVRLSIDFRLRYNDSIYRAMAPPVAGDGPDSVDSRVSYPQWQQVGTRTLLTFTHSVNDIARAATSSSPVNQIPYRLLPLV